MTTGTIGTARPPASEQQIDIPGLVWAFRIHPDGSAKSLPSDAPLSIHGDGLIWLHLNLADARCMQWLENTKLAIPDQAKTLLLGKEAFQQIHSSDESVFGVLSDMLRDIGETADETGLLRFVLTEQILVSGRHHALCAVDMTRRSLESGRHIEGPAALLEAIIENVAATMEGVADRIAILIDEIEERLVADDTKDSLKTLSRLRRTCVRLHRQLSGMKSVFRRLEDGDHAKLRARLRIRASRLVQRLDSLDHRIVEMRERSRVLQEELHLQIGEQSNESLRVLSILTALLLPPTLVTGVFGMNTKGLPLTDVESGFVYATCLIVASSASAYFVMRRLGLIR